MKGIPETLACIIFWCLVPVSIRFFFFTEVFEQIRQDMKIIRQDMEAKGLSEDILLDRNEWRKLIHVA